MDKREPVVIAKVSADSEASVIKSLLESYDIPCHYTTGFPNRLYPWPDPNPARISIYVPAALEQEARHVLDEHLRHQSPLRPVED